MLIARAAAFALPEVVIARTDGEATFRPLRRFSLSLTAASTVFMIVFLATPLIGFYLLVVQDLTAPVAAMAREGLLIFLALPGLTTMISWLRGLLIDASATGAVNGGMAINLIVTTAFLFLGISQNWPGINSAAIALTLAAVAELVFLWWRTRGVLRFNFSIIDFRKSPVVSGGSRIS
jgi:hypothetical protein